MAKTINWPQQFHDEVINEVEDSIKLAIRPGRLYYDTHYYKKGDIVDIRIENTVVRRAMVHDDLKIITVKDIQQVELNLFKKSLQSKEAIINFLSERYDLCADENTEVTLIAYRNMDLVDTSENEDPHF